LFSSVCGGTFSEGSGMIQSPNYPAPYPGSKQCVYIIGLDPGKAIQMNFLGFDIEGSVNCIFDFIEVFISFINNIRMFIKVCLFFLVKIRDGDTSNSTLIGRYCGGPDAIPPPILSTHNYLWIKFQTDSSIHNLGFLANYSAVDVGN